MNFKSQKESKKGVNVPNTYILHLDTYESLYELNIFLRIFG